MENKIIHAHMRNLINSNFCLDPYGTVDCTKLAEMTADDLNLHEGDDFDIPEVVFEIAVKVKDEY